MLKQGDQFSGKPWQFWKVMKSIERSLKPWKSEDILAIYLGSQEIIAFSSALESSTHIMFMLRYGESEKLSKMVLSYSTPCH